MPCIVRLIDRDEELRGLQQPWEALAAAPGASFFSTFAFVSRAWEHSRGNGDSLFVLTLWDDASGSAHLVAVAPWRLTVKTQRGVPIRRLEWIAAWEGDRPRLLCAGDPVAAWRAIILFLQVHRRRWDVLDLVEQDEQVTVAIREGFGGPGWSVNAEADTESFFIDLDQRFDQYLDARPAKVRANWRNRRKRLIGERPDRPLRAVSDPESIEAAFDAFVALERSGWKSGADVGAAKDDHHRRFYRSLLVDCAARGEATLYFLTVDGRDAAASMFFKFGHTYYERHIAYAEDLSAFSPGILLRAEILATLMPAPSARMDLLGLRQGEAGTQHKRDWSTQTESTTRITVWRRTGRAAPFVFARSVRSWWRDRRRPNPPAA